MELYLVIWYTILTKVLYEKGADPMLEEINQKLADAKEEIRKFNKIQSEIDAYFTLKSELIQKIESLRVQLEKEDQDVVRLESKGLAHMFFTITMNYDNRMKKEVREALEARLKYEQAQKEEEDLAKTIEELNREKLAYKNCEKHYEELYEIKKSMLLQNHTKEAADILMLDEKISLYKNNIREIDEAMTAAENALVFMDNLMDRLQSFSSEEKIYNDPDHNADNQEKDILTVAQRTLYRLKVELSDVKIPQQTKLNAGTYAGFSDMIFESLLSGYGTSPTSMTAKEVINIMDGINSIMKALKDMRIIEDQELKHLADKQAALISKL